MFAAPGMRRHHLAQAILSRAPSVHQTIHGTTGFDEATGECMHLAGNGAVGHPVFAMRANLMPRTRGATT